MKHSTSAWLALLAGLLGGGAQAASQAPVAAEHGMVVTAQAYATRVGVDVLKRGGNAVDAAVAVGYALAVVYPAAGNLGGGGFMKLQLAMAQDLIDFRETAPLAATATMYLDPAGNVVPALSTRGYLAVAVPGSVAGLEYAREKYGTRPRAELIAPAIRLAEGGFVLGRVTPRCCARPRKISARMHRVRHLPREGPAARRRHHAGPTRPRAHAAPHLAARHRRLLPG
jgi:gamma-glutamyltranspeptidase/glutathione hydrolase